ncbi:MAG: FISUMP domain-containing protein [Bacteroidales bacterium]
MVTHPIKRIPWVLLILMAATLLACNPENGDWVPQVVMTVKPESGLTTQVFEFTVDITNLPSSQNEFYVRWDLNGDSIWDDSYSACKIIPWRFFKPGFHKYRAEILTKDGQQIVISKEITIDQGYSAPHADFEINPPIGNIFTEFTFDGSDTFDDEDSLSTLKYRWDFDGDGIWDTDYNSNPVEKHQFNKIGKYSVLFSAIDPTHRISNVTRSLEVNMIDERIHPDFTWSSRNGTVKDTFYLDASSSYYETDPNKVFTYSWYVFAEDNYGPFNKPVFPHVFSGYGVQKIILTVTDELGLSNSCTKELYVIKENIPPTPGIELSTPFGNINTSFYLSAWPSRDDVDPPSELLYRWDFEGDGVWDTGWSDAMALFHQFKIPGTYWITLQAMDTGGEKGTTKVRVMVSASAAQTGYIKDNRDNKFYGTVKIGELWWMSDNLNYEVDPKMDYSFQVCLDEEYGSLYEGYTAVDFINAGYRLCPQGWRLPTKEDFLELRDHIPESGGRDAMMIGGSLGFNVRYVGKDDVIYLSSTQRRNYVYETQMQFYMGLQNDFEGVDFLWGNIKAYYYVRCIKDQ